MSAEIETLVAEFAEPAPREPSRRASDADWGALMDVDVEAEILKRQTSVRQALAKSDPERTKAAIKAYKQNLPAYLRAGRERQVVAYDGKHQVAIAPTLERLIHELKRRGIPNIDGLFMKHILPLPDEGETRRSRNK